jgi:hypothetical protein
MDIGIEQARQGLITLSLEKSLLELGTPILEKVTNMLYKKYHSYLSDCYEHPDYLKSVLAEIFGGSYSAIFSKIELELKEFSYQKPIGQFLTVLAN